MRRPAGLAQNPGADLPGRVVTQVLSVATLQLGDPFLLGVLMVAHDSAIRKFHPLLFQSTGPASSRKWDAFGGQALMIAIPREN